jgi:non-lysosomal glucosylceramidase
MTPPLDRTARAAAFPLGGIGTGNVSIGARGELRDWELENHPDKGHHNPFTFFAITAQPDGGTRVSRVLESRLTPPHGGDQGYSVDQLGGLPRLAESTMRGEYPLLGIDFYDETLPVEVSLEAFTPFVPLDPDESGIPVAVLRYRVRNPGVVGVDVTVAGTLANPIGARAYQQDRRDDFDAPVAIERRDDGVLRGLHFTSELPADAVRSGTLSLVTAAADITSKRQWLVGFWNDGARAFWNDFSDDGRLDDEPVFSLDSDLPPLLAAMEGQGAAERLEQHVTRRRVGSLGIVRRIEPGASEEFEFLLAWSFPNRPTGWLGHVIRDDPNAATVQRNHYATRFADSWAAARHTHDERVRLEGATRRFHSALHDSTLDPAIIDAVSSTLVVVRSTTCFRLEDGTFAAWEGSFDHAGSCEGTCTHVWSYAHTVAHLFPSLERSARRIEFLLETDDEGCMQFRTNRLFGGPSWGMIPAVDGQLGTVLRLYREWRFSGDDEFLRELWPAAVRALDYVGRWDEDGDGLLDARMHNTYDIEFAGAEPLANGYYIAALLAGARMAAHIDEPAIANRYRTAADRATARMDEYLFDGEYYRQRIEDVDAFRYQYGDGVLSDQLLGQTMAHVVGLGTILDPDHVKSALRAIHTHNFRADLSRQESTQRTFALDDEAGLLLASWPHGGRPRIPFVYSDEVWTGVEYQVATCLAYEGMTEEALEIVRALRARYDGVRRSPWNEVECGNHYARSLASWGVLLAFTGADWDGTTRTLRFAPAQAGELRAIFSTGSATGVIEISDRRVTLRVDEGRADIARLVIADTEVATNLSVGAGQAATIDVSVGHGA